MTDHIKHLQGQGLPVTELNRLLSIVMDVENLSMCVQREEDFDSKLIYFSLYKVHIDIVNNLQAPLQLAPFLPYFPLYIL